MIHPNPNHSRTAAGERQAVVKRRPRTRFAATLAALASAFILGGIHHNAHAVLVNLDTTLLGGTSARLDFALLDGDGDDRQQQFHDQFNRHRRHARRQPIAALLHRWPTVHDHRCARTRPVSAGPHAGDDAVVRDELHTRNFSGNGAPDRLSLLLLDAGSNFTLLDTNLDFRRPGARPGRAAVVDHAPGVGQVRFATVSSPALPIAVPEPNAGALCRSLGLVLLGGRRIRRRQFLRIPGVPRLPRKPSLSPSTTPDRENEHEDPLPHQPPFPAALLLRRVPALPVSQVFAANHREAPLTALDHKADITDWFAFVSYDDPTKVTMILNTDPLLEPANAPNYHPFDPEVVYEMKVDNNFDGDEDVKIVFRFQSEIRAPGVFTGFVGAGGGIVAPANSPAPVPPGTPIVPPAITALDGPGRRA
jgi:hypothetical protein